MNDIWGVLPKIHLTSQVCQDWNFDEAIFPLLHLLPQQKGTLSDCCQVCLKKFTLFRIVRKGQQIWPSFGKKQKMQFDDIVHLPLSYLFPLFFHCSPPYLLLIISIVKSLFPLFFHWSPPRVVLIISIVNPAPHNMAMKVAKTFPFPQTQTQQKKKASLTSHCTQELCKMSNILPNTQTSFYSY